jgi:hypothetical protein
MLVLVTLRVTLLELLRRNAGVAGMTATTCLRSTNLVFPVLHLLTLLFSHYGPVEMLEGTESVVHQLIVKGINQTSHKMVLPLSIRIDIFWCIA